MTTELDLGLVTDIPDGEVQHVSVGPDEFAVCRSGDEVFVTSARCTHGNVLLTDGFLDGFEIECPLHGGRFDVRTGAATCGPASDPIACYLVELRAGRVIVKQS